ncbi:MAG: hypothetical protein ACE5DM_01370 [Candidatus Nanoarchaeia archaeon]
MNAIEMFKIMYRSNKKLFVIAVLVVAALVLIGCSSGTTGSAGAPSSQFVGGGCG